MTKKQYPDGVHSISNDDYHSSAGLSRSALWKLKRSPLHYWNEYLNPEFIKDEPGKELILGNLVHTMLLEPDLIAHQYITRPEPDPLPTALKLKDVGREAFDKNKTEREAISVANDMMMDDFNKCSDGFIVIDKDMWQQANFMVNSLRSNELTSSLIDGAKVEQSIYFTHKATGIQCKVRPDAWLGSIVTDIKTTADASKKAFQSSAARYGYFLQSGMIHQAMDSIGVTLEKFIFHCVEKKSPFAVETYALDDDAIDYGVNLFDELMMQYADCLERNRWPGLGVQTLSIPKWLMFE